MNLLAKSLPDVYPVLARLHKLGVIVRLVDGRISAKSSDSIMPIDAMKLLKEHRAAILAYLQEMAEQPAITVLCPEPEQPCCVCGARWWIATLLPGVQDTHPGASSWECGQCHPEAALSNGRILDYGDVAAIRKDIADAVHGRGKYAPDYVAPDTEKDTDPALSVVERTREPEHRTEHKKDTGQDTPDTRRWGTVYADIRAGRAITESGAAFTFPENCSLSTFLALALDITPVNRVFLCGALPGETESTEHYINWLADGSMMAEYKTDKRCHYLPIDDKDACTARYQHRVTNNRIDIRSIAGWLGDDRDTTGQQLYTIEDARAALALVERYIKMRFPFFKHISGTPSTTFKNLWEEGNRIAGKQFTPLASDVQRLIRNVRGQGRIEFFADHSAGKKLPGLHYYDGIFMYAALTGELPTELRSHDTVNEYAGYTPARYRITYTVPMDWQHVGFFMTRRNDGGWFYPGAGCSGQSFETWADGAELMVLIQHYAQPITPPENATKAEIAALKKAAQSQSQARAFAAWNITICERLVFAPAKESQKPLETITGKIVALREQIDIDRRQDAENARIYGLARGAIRNILLHGIGSFSRGQKTRSFIALASEGRPKGFDRNCEEWPMDDKRVLYTMPEPESDDPQAFPQWAALVWARCRARMTKHALSQPYENIIAIRTDAIAVAQPVDAWEHGTKTGELRCKWRVPKRLSGPSTDMELDELQRRVLAAQK